MLACIKSVPGWIVDQEVGLSTTHMGWEMGGVPREEGLWVGLTPKRYHNLWRIWIMLLWTSLWKLLFYLSLEYVLQSGLTGPQSGNSQLLILRQCDLGHADDRRGNKGVGKYWSGDSQEDLPYLRDMAFKPLPVPPSVSTRMNKFSSHSFIGGWVSRIHWTKEMRGR